MKTNSSENLNDVSARARRNMVCLGDVNVDLVASASRLPAVGTETTMATFGAEPGGSAANVAVAFSRLGFPAALISKVGRDDSGHWLLEALAENHVATKYVRVDATMTGLAFVVVTPDGQRTIFDIKGANQRLSPEDITKASIVDSSMLYVSGYALLGKPQRFAALRALRLAHELGRKTCLDLRAEAQWRIPGFRSFLRNVDILSATTEAWLNLRWEALRSRKSLCNPRGVVVYSRENNDATIVTGGRRERIPSFRVKVANLLAANDAFVAGLLHSISAAKNLGQAVRIAQACKALTASSIEGSTWQRFPKRRQVGVLLRRGVRMKPPSGGERLP